MKYAYSKLFFTDILEDKHTTIYNSYICVPTNELHYTDKFFMPLSDAVVVVNGKDGLRM